MMETAAENVLDGRSVSLCPRCERENAPQVITGQGASERWHYGCACGLHWTIVPPEHRPRPTVGGNLDTKG